MEAHPRRLKTVFRSDVRLVVPLFQRPYVWDEDDQWAPLWDDVIAAFDRRDDSDTAPHFLGAIVLEQKRGALGSLEVREVIDGQQRLTTLQLLSAALRDTYLAEGASTRLFKGISKTLLNDPDYVDIDQPGERLKLYPTNLDRRPYAEVMDGIHRESTPDPSFPRIVLAYLYFRRRIDELVAACINADEVEEVLDGLAEVILEYLEMVVIDLGTEDNAQVIFETLNARGTALRASDLIKNALFRTLQDGARDVERLYRRYWEPLEGPQWQKEVRVGRLSWPRIDVFVGYFLTVLLQREVLSHQLFQTARRYFSSDAERAEEFLVELARYADIYDRIDDRSISSDAETLILDRLEIVDTQTITPTILWLFANSGGAERMRALQLIEAYLIRRAICRLTQKNYNRLFLELLARLESADEPADVVVERYLTGQRSESGTWPTDGQLADSMLRLPLFRLFKRDRLQRLLLAFENALTTSRTESVPVSKRLSVEHLMPQTWQEHWPLAGSGNPELEEEARDSLVHTIGNLTLITGPLNSSIQNGSWSAKRSAILRNSALSLNRDLPPGWTTEAIEARSRSLALLAARTWIRPSDAPVQNSIADSERDLRPDRDRANPGTREPRGSNSVRRDIGQHIVSVFSDIEPGEALTCGEIARTPSEQYPANDLPSQGAIYARLFPSNGRPTNVPGVEAAMVNGKRGARKLAR